MKKWWIVLVSVLLVAALITGIVLLVREPYSLRALKREIKENGYASEQTGQTLLKLSEQSKAYETANGAINLYRIVDNKADGYVCLVNLFFTESGMKEGAYEWKATIERTNEAATYHAEGKVEAGTFSPEKKDIGFTLTYEQKEADALARFYLESYVYEALYDILADLDEYLAEKDMGLTVSDYGFAEFREKSK